MPRTAKQSAAYHKRMLVWMHNSLFGRVARAIKAMQAIKESKTTTQESKTLAASLEEELNNLYKTLKKRNDNG